MSEITGTYHVLNGEIKDNITFDSSFLERPHYIYEVFRTVDGIPLFVEDHIDRFKHSMQISNITVPYLKEEIESHINMLVDKNKLKVGNIKMVFLPGDNASGFKLYIYITPHNYPIEKQYKFGVPVIFYNGTRDNPNAKIMDSALRSVTDRNRVKHNVYEVLLVDKDGYVTEGSRSNIFFIKDDKVVTPPMDFILPGITRKHIISLCEGLNINLDERKVHKKEVVDMEGVFISGTSRKVLPVNRIEKHKFSPYHPLLLEVKEGFNKKIEAYLSNKKL